MKYNIYFKNITGSFNILCISSTQLEIVVNAYKKALPQITISGQNYFISDLIEIKIYEYDKTMSVDDFRQYCFRNGMYKTKFTLSYIPPYNLSIFGKDITGDIIGNTQYGESKIAKSNKADFVNDSRILELKQITSEKFDLIRLIRLCEEANDNYRSENYMSVAMIGRTIINHIPPIFNYANFNEVTNNYSGSPSFKKSMASLNNSLKNISDSLLHQVIRNKDSLPNNTQVNFSQDLDVLLCEIVRLLK